MMDTDLAAGAVDTTGDHSLEHLRAVAATIDLDDPNPLAALGRGIHLPTYHDHMRITPSSPRVQAAIAAAMPTDMSPVEADVLCRLAPNFTGTVGDLVTTVRAATQ